MLQSFEYNKRVQILNVQIDNLSISEVLEQLKSGLVLTPNVDHLMKLQKDKEFLEIYEQADYRLCDSQVLLYASYFLGSPLKERVSGSDFFPMFCEFHKANSEIRIFLLGGRDGAPEKAADKINQRLNQQVIVGTYSPPFNFENNEQECLHIIDEINRSKATVLAVGVGAPKQEKWIYKHKTLLPHIQIFLAIGATINFEAGIVPRAPEWMSNSGLEWLYRLFAEPQRLWKRYLVDDLPFLWLILQQRFGFYKSPQLSTSVNPSYSTEVNHSYR